MNIFHVPVAIERPLTETERGVSDARCAKIVRVAISEALADYANNLSIILVARDKPSEVSAS